LNKSEPPSKRVRVLSASIIPTSIGIFKGGNLQQTENILWRKRLPEDKATSTSVHEPLPKRHRSMAPGWSRFETRNLRWQRGTENIFGTLLGRVCFYDLIKSANFDFNLMKLLSNFINCTSVLKGISIGNSILFLQLFCLLICALQ